MTEDENQSAIQGFYDQKTEYEWGRLDRHRMEFQLTLRAVLERLPPAPAAILDCGGGPGRYSIELARRGYAVTLFDLSAANLKFAEAKASQTGLSLAAAVQGTATDLSRFSDGQFDAVLLMGPLYHLLEEAGRRQALAEARRVLKPGGWLFAAFISRYAAHRDLAQHKPASLLEDQVISNRILETGKLPPGPNPAENFVAYFAHPDEVAPLIWSSGFELETVLGVEGLVSGFDETLNSLPPETWDLWANLNYRIAPDPSIHGAVEHLLAVAARPRWQAALARIAQRLDGTGITWKVVGGASLALHGVPQRVKDIDIETPAGDAYRFGELFAAETTLPVAFRTGETYRSHFGKFEIEGVTVEVMGDLQRLEDGQWLPTDTQTQTFIPLFNAQARVPASWLEEETLTCLRRGRLERAALCLPLCNPERLRALLKPGQTNVI